MRPRGLDHYTADRKTKGLSGDRGSRRASSSRSSTRGSFRVQSRFLDRDGERQPLVLDVAAIVISAPGGENLAAFSRRLHRTRSISTASIATSGRSATARPARVRPQGLADDLETGADDFLYRLPFQAQRRLAGLQPRHVEQIGDHAVQMHCRYLIAAAVSRRSRRGWTAPARESARP